MKKIISILIAAVMMLTLLTACGSTQTQTPAQTEAPAETEADTAAEEAEQTETESAEPEAKEEAEQDVSASDAVEEEAKYGGTFKMSFNAPTNSLDPAQFYTNQNTTPGYHIYEGPVQLDEGGGVWPGVCEYAMSEDGTELTFTVREGVKFHNGDTVDVNDVVASISRSLIWSEKMQKYFGAYITDTEITDDMTVTYHLSELAPLALLTIGDLTSCCKIMPAEIVEKLGDDGLITEDADVIGTGPYMLGTWERDVSLELVRFEDYVPYESGGTGPAAPKMAYFDKIYFTAISDEMARTTAMMAGELDYCTGIVADMKDQVLETGCWIDTNWNGWSPTVMFNLSENNADSIVQDVNFRRAVLACMDMVAIRNTMGRAPEFYKVDSCVVPDTSIYYNNILPHDNSNFDVDAAKEYLEASGYNGETVTWICADSDSYYKLSLPASQMLQSIGVNVDLQVHEVATYEQEFIDSTADFDICARENQKPSINPMLSDRYVSGNVTGWWESDARTAALEKLSTSVAGSEESIAAFEEFCQAVADEVPYIIAFELGTPCYYSEHTVPDRAGINYYVWNSYFTDNT